MSSVTRVVLREQVKELILERILNETYRPGERLVETRIAAELGTSPAPVRAALRVLFETWLSLGIEARTIVTALRAGLDGHEIAERHRPVLEALRARDPELAGTTLRRHVEQFGELLKGATAV